MRTFVRVNRFQVRPRKLHFFENAGSIFQQMPAMLSQLCLATESVEKAAFQFLLQRFDCMADSRLGEKQLTGGLGEAAAARKGHKSEQLPTVENGLHRDSGVRHRND